MFCDRRNNKLGFFFLEVLRNDFANEIDSPINSAKTKRNKAQRGPSRRSFLVATELNRSAHNCCPRRIMSVQAEVLQNKIDDKSGVSMKLLIYFLFSGNFMIWTFDKTSIAYHLDGLTSISSSMTRTSFFLLGSVPVVVEDALIVISNITTKTRGLSTIQSQNDTTVDEKHKPSSYYVCM